MTDRFEIRRATAADEPDLRALVGSVAMPGAVDVRFAREPDCYALKWTADPAARLDGRVPQVEIATL